MLSYDHHLDQHDFVANRDVSQMSSGRSRPVSSRSPRKRRDPPDHGVGVGGDAVKVLVFDIDGTLTATASVDGRLFAEALGTVLTLPSEEPWFGLAELTDAAILAELCAARPAAERIVVEREVQRRFFASLDAAVESEPEAFQPISGAREIFEAIRLAGWKPAIATGAWRRSAETKLTAAEIPISGVPLVTSSEHPRRVDIIRHAVRLAASAYEPEEVVYVGDGSWDVVACRELGIGFVGRAAAGNAQPLIDLGAKAVLPDFSDASALLDLLSAPSALIPQRGG
jgi:phosphoglycolate phosphatase-like HAD superfamily hydrolase